MYILNRRIFVLIMLISILASIEGCSTESGSAKIGELETTSAKIFLSMAPDIPEEEITSARVVITASDIGNMELDLAFDQGEGKATGSINMPAGDNRLFSAQVYAGDKLRYVGQRQLDIYEDTLVEIYMKPMPEEPFYQVQVNRSFIFSLDANPGTGYEWQTEFDSRMLKLINREFARDSELIGAGGTESLRFLGLKEGLTELIMILKRPWEADYLEKLVIPVEILPRSSMPLLSLSRFSLEFGAMRSKSSFIIMNSGSGTLNWSIFPDLPEWLRLSVLSGELASDETASVSVEMSGQDEKPGTYKHDITVISNGGMGIMSITMEINQLL